ncbi:Uncharacterised protein [Mycobacterium tuberculosis]|nr:Uncharacterised protein [Mycobacterium tuberculosis]
MTVRATKPSRSRERSVCVSTLALTPGMALPTSAYLRGPVASSQRTIVLHCLPTMPSSWFIGHVSMKAPNAGLVDEGRLTLRVADALPLAEARKAHARLESGGLRGRLVLIP